jgi:hypothetical protein
MQELDDNLNLIFMKTIIIPDRVQMDNTVEKIHNPLEKIPFYKISY